MSGVMDSQGDPYDLALAPSYKILAETEVNFELSLSHMGWL